MAFMMPVMKNNYEIYPGKAAVGRRPRSRKNSSASSLGGCQPAAPAPTGRSPGSHPESRSVSESYRSSSSGLCPAQSPSRLLYSSSAPSSSTLAAVRSQRTVRFCRSVSQDGSSRRSAPAGSCPVASGYGSEQRSQTGSSTSTSSSGNDGSASNVEAGSPKFGSLSRFHSRLIDKLKRKFRMKDDADVCSAEDDSSVIRSST